MRNCRAGELSCAFGRERDRARALVGLSEVSARFGLQRRGGAIGEENDCNDVKESATVRAEVHSTLAAQRRGPKETSAPAHLNVSQASGRGDIGLPSCTEPRPKMGPGTGPALQALPGAPRALSAPLSV
jgi:hypothetical protein